MSTEEDELLVEGEEWDQEGSLRAEVRDEKLDDPESFGRLPMAFSVRFNACSTISMVHTLWCRDGDAPPADKFRSSSRSEFGAVLFKLTVLRGSSNCKLHNCLPVENDNRCGDSPDDADDVDARKLSSCNVSLLLLARNS
jgi:hypothetical protein